MRNTRPAMVLGVTAVCAALTLTACSSGSSGASSTGGSSTSGSGGGSITVWTWDGAPGTAAMTQLATEYQKETGITVNSKVISRDTYKQQAQLALNSKEKIDVLGVQPGQFALDIQAQMMPVSKWKDGASLLGAYAKNTIDQSKRLYGSDELYSVPFGSSGSAVCYYNADILKEVGAQPPATWTDMAAFTKALKAKDPNILPLVMPAGGTDGWFQDEFVLTMVGQHDASFFNDVRYKNGKWDTASYAAAVKQYGDIFANGTLDRAGLDLGYTDAMNAFNTGKAAIVCNGTWEAGMLLKSYRQQNGISASAIGVMPVPTDGSGTPSLRSFLDITWGIPQSAPNPDGAEAFIAWATTGKGVSLWANALGFVPAASSWKIDTSVFGDDKLAADGYAEIQKLITNPSSDRNNMSNLSAQIGKHLLDVANGGTSAADAVKAIQSDADSGKYN